MSSRKWAAAPVLALSLLLALGGVALAATPSSPTSAGGVAPYIVDNPGPGGNVTCAALGYESSSARVNYSSGSFDAPFPAGITVNVTGGTYVSWTSTFDIGAVIVKGSAAANIYEYSPASLGDSGLASPLTPSGSPAGLSNLTFCWEGERDPEKGRIIVDKVTLPAGSQQAFEFTPDWDDPFSLTDEQQPYDSGLLEPGDYSVTEDVPEGWELTSAVCVVLLEEPELPIEETLLLDVLQESVPLVLLQEMSPEGITLEAGQTVVCTFSNTADGRIIVEKVAANAPQGYEFEFDPSWGANFLLAHLESEDSGLLQPGTYSVQEILSAEFILGGLVCEDPSGGSSVNLATGTATIDLAAGETVTCTFTNRMVEDPEDGRIIVEKVAANAPQGYEFEFDPSWGANFFLGHLESEDSGDLAPGVYSVSEIVPAGFVLAGAVCDDGSSPAAIGLSAGETVTCTFTNRMIPEEEEESGRIIVVKETLPAGSEVDFEFTSSWQLSFFLSDGESHDSGLLEPGVYSVSEIVPAGWLLDSAVCSDGSDPAAIDLADDETVTCTFINSQEQVLGPEGSLTIIKLTNPAGGEGFTFDAGSLGAFALDGGGSVLFSELEPGAYTVTEDDPAGDWLFQSIQCEALDWSAEGRSVTVNLAEGEAAVCTFYNIAELPFTGPASWLIPLLVIGLGALLIGGGLVLLPAVRRSTGR